MESDLQELNRWRSISSFGLLALLLAWESLSPYFAWFAGAARERVLHGLKNVALGISNAFITGAVFAALWWTTVQWAQAHDFGVLHWFPLPTGARLAVAFLLIDCWMYWWHRFNHVIPFLWRLHRMHHSDAQMDVTTASRFHIGEIALSNVLRVPVIVLLGLGLRELVLYEAAMFAVVQFHHANVALPAWFDRTLRMVIVTPFLHKVHHSRWRRETDSNYSALFSFWDRVFRSFRMRDNPHTVQFGLQEFDGEENHTLPGLLATPFKQVQRATDQPPIRTNPSL